jgi:transcriptional regulator with XRE-family HTH domain
MSRKKSPIEEKKYKNIGERIRRLRKSLRLNQTNFGHLIGLSGNFISNLELGKAPPTMPVLLVIEFRWSISPQQILTGDGFSLNSIDTSEMLEGVHETQAEYIPKLPNLLEMAKTVLESHTEHATALAFNIQAFYHAVQCATDVQELRERVNNLELRLPGQKPGKKERIKVGLKR